MHSLRKSVYQAITLLSHRQAFFQTEATSTPELWADKLKTVLKPPQIALSEAIRIQHSKDESRHKSNLPSLVLFPESTEEVSQVAKLCHSERIPMIPFGTGTGMEGGANPLNQACISVDMTRMGEVTEYHPEDMTATVQPGVTRKAINQYLKGDGLWFPVDPGANASLCGMVATSASGTNAVRYGTMRENVMNLEVVLADGTIVHTAGEGRRNRKTSAGYNLTNLFVGSEGTLGFITQATLRLYGIPESTISAVCSFSSIEDAVQAVQDVLQCGVPIARIELMDDEMIAACNSYSKLSLAVRPSLFLEFHGSPQSTQEQAQTVQEIVNSYPDSSELLWASDEAERSKLWSARHNCLYAALALRPGCVNLSTDVCVPISHLTEVIVETKRDIAKYGITGPVLGHVGDGNFHVTCVFDNRSEEEVATLSTFSNRLVKRALAVGGTCTGEHGVGIGKIHYLNDELGESTVNVMKAIKSTIDPLNLMNPGKVLQM